MGIDITIQWFDKPATRMPEGIFLSFEPTLQDGYGWMMSKSGQMIDPMNVVLNGSQRLHAIDRGVSYTDKDGNGIEFTSKDVALVSTITKTLPGTALPLPLHQTDAITGVSYNLFNNLWNLNYVLWYPFSKGDEDFKARFSINLLHQKLKAWPKISASRSYTEGTKFERL
ncbi:uncharacterized protein LOC135492306 [Lineus longissimus]|uniref:uncharacterized protein LOC135492306 n=1 Tax=Lineus longissimus TaxID=88925 RepID=UPI00315CCAB4